MFDIVADEELPNILTLTVHDLVGDITPEPGLPGIMFYNISANGEDDSLGTGEHGVPGFPIVIDYSGGSSIIVTESGPLQFPYPQPSGIIAISSAGNGGNSSGPAAYDGADGAPGGNVTIDVDSDLSTYAIITNATGGRGIAGLSFGGSGGMGSGGVSAGDGGAAGGGGEVRIHNNSFILTKGTNSQGIWALSVGGNGGAGGNSGGLWAIGGGGDRAAPGGLIRIGNTGEIKTEGAYSEGILAQSIGGFGGSGGDAGGLLAFGGSAASAGNGGRVIVENRNTIETDGTGSHAIFGQSVGGGGGSGGSAGGLVALGNEGNVGGTGGTVTIENFVGGDIHTKGGTAYGLFAQSVGGGGGNGGDSGGLITLGGSGTAGGNGGIVGVTNAASVLSEGDGSDAIFAQSIGGGGGNGGAAYSGGPQFSLAIGGNGGEGGNGGKVTVNEVDNPDQLTATTITTKGLQSRGIFAQSVGGGGGNGGVAISASIGANPVLPSVSIALGGSGSKGGSGGNVVVNQKGIIQTDSALSTGIFAQSVGGGGGNGGGSVSATVTSGTGLAFAIGGSGGEGGNGGEVTVTAIGRIVTAGDMSHGVIAQSIGGGGGNGGYSLAAGVAAVPLNLSLGGSGGLGGVGEDVTVTTLAGGLDDAAIETAGDGSIGILAQSVGGGGGNGGLAGTVGIGTAPVNISVGGKSSVDGIQVGAVAGDVNVNNAIAISTSGLNAIGIFAQSVGGGGGNGGGSFSAGLGIAALDASIGGGAGFGGPGGKVLVTNTGVVRTEGDLSYGILAQSVGGGGGNGGAAVAFGVTIAPPDIPSANLTLAIGGYGGLGGNGDDVRVQNTAEIETLGASTHAIFAQSVGGSGGSGGYAAGGAVSIGSESQVTVTVGGGAAAGGDGGEVVVGLDASGDGVSGTLLATHGDGANAIHAQSIGGGGGDGGFAGAFGIGENFTSGGTSLAVGVTVGGNGGFGGNGGQVDVYSDQLVRTFGESASGIFAQSIGGGGGNGGNAVSALVTFTDNNSATSRAISIGVSIGGSGDAGGIGGSVTVTNVDTITTGGPVLDEQGEEVIGEDGNPLIAGGGSHGILAQSIGGGGGVGGRANTINVVAGKRCTGECSPAAKVDVILSAAVGGNGGAGGDGGLVKIDNSGTIATYGITASGIFAQSIGGGGGDGGNGNLGTKELLPAEFGVIIPLAAKNNSKKYSNISVAVGGSGGVTGDGKLVEIVNSGNILTMGDNSDGIFAQSIGGGGGVAGRAAIGLTGTLGIGGKGGSGGNGGDITIDNLSGGVIETVGVASHAIYAQSIGGGGGMAGNVDRMFADAAGPVPALNLGIGAAFGQGGGNGGDGGDVTINSNGTIITHGDASVPIFAQSVGGGGGVLGSLGNELVGGPNSWAVGSNGDAGKAGKVTINHSGDVYTYGAHATGIFIQSAAGQDDAGGVGLDFAGTNAAMGLGSIAILAHSEGQNGNGNIDIMLSSKDGGVIGGASDAERSGVGVYLLGGTVNTLTSKGLLTTMGGVDSGYAVAGGEGGDAVSNFGTLIGSFDLGGGANSFTNQSDAFAYFGEIAALGTGNVATNFGWMSPGGPERVMTTEVGSSIDQKSEGTYGVDLDLARTEFDDESDLFQVSEWADIGGTVDVTILNAGSALPGNHEAFIVRTGTGVTDNGAVLVTPPSAVATYALETDQYDMWISYAIDFAPDGLNANQNALGEYINNFQLAGGSASLEPVVETIFFLPELDVYSAALDQLTPEPYVETENATVLANMRFGRSLMACPRRDDPDGDKGCVWFQGGGEKLTRSGTSDDFGYDEIAYAVQGGIGGNIGENGGAVIGFSYGNSAIDTEDIASSTGHRFNGGIGLSHTDKGSTIAIAALGGAALYDVERNIDFIDTPVTAKGDQKLYYGGGQIRLAHEAKAGAFRFAPLFEAWGGYFHHDAISETDAGAIGLDVEAGGDFFAAIRPALTLAAEFNSEQGGMFRPFITGGVTYFVAGSDMNLTSTFQGEENAVPGFETSSALEDFYVDAAAGFDMKAANGVALRLEGSAQYAESYLSYGGNARFVAPF